jgi:hypothetical protein
MNGARATFSRTRLPAGPVPLKSERQKEPAGCRRYKGEDDIRKAGCGGAAQYGAVQRSVKKYSKQVAE